MTKKKALKTAFQPGHGYSQADWDEVSDNPELTTEQHAELKPFGEVLPELAANMKKRTAGRPKKDHPKVPVSLRLDADVVDKFKATGKGWQSRINQVLAEAKV